MDIWNIKESFLNVDMLLLVVLCFALIIQKIRNAGMSADEKEFLQKQRRAEMFEQRRMSKQMPEKRRKNMYADVYLKTTANMMVRFGPIYLITLYFIGMIMNTINTIAEVFGFELKEGFVVLGIIGVLCFAGWFISIHFTGAVPKMKKEIERRGYDEEAVKRDYSRGNFFSVPMGVLNIGSTFVIYARGREGCVVLLESVRSVQRVYFRRNVKRFKADPYIVSLYMLANILSDIGVKGFKMDLDYYIVRMYTDTGMVQMWSDDIDVDLIIEEFRKRGITVKESIRDTAR